MRNAQESPGSEMERAMSSKLKVTSAELEPAPREFPQTIFTDVDFITAHTVVAQFFFSNPEKKSMPAADGKMPNRWLGRLFASD